MKNLNSLLAVVFCSVTLWSSCGFVSNDTGDKEVKVTVTVKGISADEGDIFTFSIGGSSASGAVKTPFKVNGKARNNEQSLSLTEQDFSGSTKTYVIESIENLAFLGVNFDALNTGNDYTVSYKAEINGEILNEEKNVIVSTKKSFTRAFNY